MKAEKKPVSVVLDALSIICEGLCKGIEGMGSEGMLVDEKGGINELVNRFNHIRTT